MHHQPIQNDAGDTTQNVFIARVRKFHIKEHVIDPDDADIKIMPEKFKVVARFASQGMSSAMNGRRGLDLTDSPSLSQRLRGSSAGLGKREGRS
jgi:hypothetical protein